MGKKLTTSEFIEKATKCHHGKYDYSCTNYVNSRTKVTIICPEHGSFVQTPSSHLQGNGCPICARVWSEEHRQRFQDTMRRMKGMTTEEWIARARCVHGDKFDYSQTVYVNQRTKVNIICPKHGLFEQNPDSHLRGCGCRFCGYEVGPYKFSHKWSDAQRKKIAETCMQRYGASRYLDSEVGKQKIIEIKSTPEFRQKMRDIITSDVVRHKTVQTCKNRYGVVSPMKLLRIQNKAWRSKRNNKTFSTSKTEDRMYDSLCSRFGQSDILRQYKDDCRYPFYCDFYIKSLDLFIELNASWVHNDHWFDDSNADDLMILHKWEQSVATGKRFYQAAIEIWTMRDVQKHRVALDHKLNYLVFWKNNLSDFMMWLNTKPLILNNIV